MDQVTAFGALASWYAAVGREASVMDRAAGGKFATFETIFFKSFTLQDITPHVDLLLAGVNPRHAAFILTFGLVLRDFLRTVRVVKPPHTVLPSAQVLT